MSRVLAGEAAEEVTAAKGAVMGEPSGFGDGKLVPFAGSIWTATTPVRFAGTWMPHVMTVVRLENDNVLLHSPCRPSDELLAKIASVGTVTDVVAPNWFHDLYLPEYRRLYADATFWGPAFLRRQRKAIIDCVLDGAAQPKWSAEMPHVSLPGLLTFDESIFYHVSTRTLIVADVLMNASLPPRAPLLTRFGYRLFDLRGQVKVFPVLRWFGVTSRSTIRNAVRQILEWNPERLIVGHGTPIGAAAAEQVQEAFSWLKAP
jgi:hypothetical protein